MTDGQKRAAQVLLTFITNLITVNIIGIATLILDEENRIFLGFLFVTLAILGVAAYFVYDKLNNEDGHI